LVVTHLAQVAAFADHHLSVSKVEDAGRVTTLAVPVSGARRVVEISRMLSGRPDSKRAQAHAEELLDLAGHERAAAAPR
jgi:DNA repair protein RecN (Recombination protein N)